MTQPYPWYEIQGADAGLSQGDIFYQCPVLVPSIDEELAPDVVIEAGVDELNVIVMSQSCDLEYGKIDLVLLCSIWPLATMAGTNSFFKSKDGREALRRGNLPAYHLLNKVEIEEFSTDYWVVDFRAVYTVPFVFLSQRAKQTEKRIRLLPPYREHMSQAFARFFMRVGLPIDIAEIKQEQK